MLHGRDVQAILAPLDELHAAMERLYPSGADSVETRTDDEFGGVDENSDGDGDDAPVIRLCSMIISNAIKMKCSDIHLEPMEKEFRVRYRIDGALRKMDSPPKNYDDMINMPCPTSPRHPRMPRADRAAQFAPFAALTGKLVPTSAAQNRV